MCSKCTEEVTNPPTQVSLIGGDFRIAFELLNLFAINIKKEICDVLESFPSFKEDLKKKKKMVCLILDPRFKSLSNIFLYWS
jgi:hypothetical protein